MTNQEKSASRVFAVCYQTGEIEFAPSIPRGTIKLACGEENQLRVRIMNVARLAYDNVTMLVPGVPEASTNQSAMEAVWEFIERLNEPATREAA